MSEAIRIEISDEPTSDIVHRFRNFGEDVYRSLRDTCSVCIEEIDASTTSFIVRDIRRRDLGDVAFAELRPPLSRNDAVENQEVQPKHDREALFAERTSRPRGYHRLASASGRGNLSLQIHKKESS